MNEKFEIHLLKNKTMSLHEKIRIIRNAKGLSQESVALELNIDAVNYGRLERGQSKITVDRLERIAKILGVKTVVFFMDETEVNGDELINNHILNEILNEVKIIREEISK